MASPTHDDSKADTKPRARKAPTPKPASPAAATDKAGFGGSTAAVLGVAAVGVFAGLAANLGRKAAVQAPSAMTGDWFAAIKAEHKATLLLMDAMAKTTDKNTAKRATLLMQIKHALAKHAFMEEMVVYPALREAGDPQDADKLNHEHGYVKQYLYELTNLEKSSPVFLDKVAALRAELDKHIAEEENEIFPPFHAKLSDAKNKAITAAANKEAFKLA
ncbi:MAG: hemerythrin protein [Sphingomonas bacterium]|jgi:hemerythrin-like domain-containing protein|nr:hemerythrin domain-containing protein [Sphingomonas bacterium]MDB5689952.1 hemerythrin protein [Sphingomonas bacterium]